MDYTVHDTPWPHGHSESFIDEDRARRMSVHFPNWADKWPKKFKSKHGYKKECSDIALMPEVISKFIQDVYSDKFVSRLSDTFNIPLTVDWSLYGAGLNIYPPHSHLHKHIDFNFNNNLKKYRAVNLLYFLNDNWTPSDGGAFELYYNHHESHESIKPKLNTCVIFATNNQTPHGVGATRNNFYRKSINLWYYTDQPTDLMDTKPHRTLWQN